MASCCWLRHGAFVDLCLSQGARLCLVPAVKQAHDLVITFQLPSLADEYLAKAEDYLSSLIGHEGRGSLLSALKARGWATGLSAGVPEGGYERNTGLYLFDISVTLTEPGLQAGAGTASLQPTSVKRTLSILLGLSLTAQEELQSILQTSHNSASFERSTHCGQC